MAHVRQFGVELLEAYIANFPIDVVRAVAGLLHSIQAIKSTPQSFKQDYEKGLRVYQDLKLDDGPRQPGEVSTVDSQ